MSRNLGSSTSENLKGLSRRVQGLLYLFNDNGQCEQETLPIATKYALDFLAYWKVCEGNAVRLSHLAIFEMFLGQGMKSTVLCDKMPYSLVNLQGITF